MRKLFARINADALERALGVWMWTRINTIEGHRAIAVDGKTIRGARTHPGGKAQHLIAAFDHGAGAVPEFLAVLVDERTDQRCSGSHSRAKKVVAALRISISLDCSATNARNRTDSARS
ncbi:MAG: hypothetical protein J2P17_29175 [Mycobacterium sp.]|nr:hypothetical protein [Mycobacterium sp.]